MGAEYVSDDRNPYQKIKELVGLAIGQASVLFKSEDVMRLDGVFDDAQAREIVDQLMADIDTYAEACWHEHMKVQEEKRKFIGTKEGWHNSPDAMLWAEKFTAMHMGKLIVVNGDGAAARADVGLMVSWFANAMAAASHNAEYDLAGARNQKGRDDEKIAALREQNNGQYQMLEGIRAIVEGRVKFQDMNTLGEEGLADMKPTPVLESYQTTPPEAVPLPKPTGRGRTPEGRAYIDFDDGSRRYLMQDNPQA